MPATSKAQARFMNMISHSPEMSKETGVAQSVGKEFSTSRDRYRSLPERKESSMAKKKFIKKDHGEQKLKAKLSEPKKKSEDEKLKSRYGSDK
jgi:hypothetical protein